MKPIENWNQINEAGEFKPLPAGIYGLVIKDAEDVSENEYIKISLDICSGEFKDYFRNIKCNYIRSYKETALAFFKAFITAVEKSNSGYNWDWDEKKLVGKNVIGVFGEEEYVANDGSVKTRVVLHEVRSSEAYKEGKIKVPELKKLSEEDKARRLNELNLTSTTNTVASPVLDDALPF